MKELTIGKLRGLQQIATRAGIFTMCAMDHRGTMQRMINPVNPKLVSAERLTQYKQELCATLAPVSSAVLLDPIYGAAQVIASTALPRDTGLLVSLEATGYVGESEARLTELLPGWSVEKVRRMGATASKLLAYYHPGQPDSAARQRDLVCRVAQESDRVDLPLLVETVAYPISDRDRDPAEFARQKPGLVVETARQVTPLGLDVLKTEFPANLRYEHDDARLLEYCQQLDAAAQVPWVLLSAGVTFEEFVRQVEIASRAGASGFLAGRAVWQEAMTIVDSTDRRVWLETVAADRIRRLTDVANTYGRPWWKKWGSSPTHLAHVDEHWHETY